MLLLLQHFANTVFLLFPIPSLGAPTLKLHTTRTSR